MDDNKHFRLKGKEIHDVRELAAAIEILPDSDFEHFVGPNHNYFVPWIRDVIGDAGLAGMLEPVKSKEETIKILSTRLAVKGAPEKKEHHTPDKQEAEKKKEAKASLTWKLGHEFWLGLGAGIVLGIIMSHWVR